MEEYFISRNNLNKINFVILGFVWTKFLTPSNYPIIDVECHLMCNNEELDIQKTNKNGEVKWGQIPFEELEIKLKISDRSLIVPIPWLQTPKNVHEQRVMDAATLVGPNECSFGIQVRLQGLGYDCGAVDGNLGPKSQSAVKQFQSDYGLEPDGIAGSITAELLANIFEA